TRPWLMYWPVYFTIGAQVNDFRRRQHRMSNHPVQVIAVTGGEGGVGKTNVSVNLALALAELGRRVVLMDADLGLANVDVQLGLRPQATLADVLSGTCSLREVMVNGPGGIRIVPAASGAAEMVNLGPREHAGLI